MQVLEFNFCNDGLKYQSLIEVNASYIGDWDGAYPWLDMYQSLIEVNARRKNI